MGMKLEENRGCPLDKQLESSQEFAWDEVPTSTDFPRRYSDDVRHGLRADLNLLL